MPIHQSIQSSVHITWPSISPMAASVWFYPSQSKSPCWSLSMTAVTGIFQLASSAEVKKKQKALFTVRSSLDITVLHGWLKLLLWTSDRNTSHNYVLAAFPTVEPWEKDKEVVFSVCVAYPADHFKEICPAGHGYTYSLSDVQISVRQLGGDGVQSTGVSWEEQSHVYPQAPSSHPSRPHSFGPQHPSYPQTPQVPQYSEYLETPQSPQHPLIPHQPHHPSPPVTPRQPEGEKKIKCLVYWISFGKCFFLILKHG